MVLKNCFIIIVTFYMLLCVCSGPLYVMIPPSSSAEILHAMGRPIGPKMSGISTMDYHTADPIVQMQL